MLSVNVLGINTGFDGKNPTENVTCPVTRSPDYYLSVLWCILTIEKSTFTSGLCSP